MSHREAQQAAREAKRLRQAQRELDERAKAFQRALVTVTVPKEELLKLLIAENYLPEGATRIVATGHLPAELLVTYTKD